MDERESFIVEKLGVTVEQSTDALTYTFQPKGPAFRPGLSFFPGLLVLFFVGIPLVLLGLVGYAYSKTMNRPQWEEVLTGVFVAQLFVWLVVGIGETVTTLRWSLRGMTTVLRFTRTEVRHGGNRVCELEDIRALRLITFPATDEAGKVESCLSLVIGEDGGTHGLLGGFEQHQLRILAEDVQRRLARFRFDQGIVSSLESLSVVEAATDEEAAKLMHTRPAQGGFRMFAGGAFSLLFNRFFGSLWCLAMFAGLVASARLVLAAGLHPAFLIGHIPIGLMHLALLLAIWNTSARPAVPQNHEETS